MLLVCREICKVYESVSVHNSQKNQKKFQKDKNKPTRRTCKLALITISNNYISIGNYPKM